MMWLLPLRKGQVMSNITKALEAELAAIRDVAAQAASRALTLCERARVGRHFTRLVQLSRQDQVIFQGSCGSAFASFAARERWQPGVTMIRPGTVDPCHLGRLEARIDRERRVRKIRLS
jgi:hypothetical protein